jgi:phosphomannomutase
MFDYAFAENGLTAYKDGQPLPSQSFINFLGEERYKKLVRFILHYIADLDIPIKRCVANARSLGATSKLPHRGTFIEFRNGEPLPGER